MNCRGPMPSILLLTLPFCSFFACVSFFSSGAAVNPDGPAPKGMLANYTVLLTTVPPPRPPSPSSPLPSVSSPDDAAVPTPGTAAVAAAYGEEADVRDALVDRDVGESIVCRRRYRILPDFGPGDRPYVVRGDGKRAPAVLDR